MIFSSISLTSLKSDSDCILIRFPPERTFSASYREGGSSQPCKNLSRPLCNPGFLKMYPTFSLFELQLWKNSTRLLIAMLRCFITGYARKTPFLKGLGPWTSKTHEIHSGRIFLRPDAKPRQMNGKQQNSSGAWQQNTRSQNSAPNTSCSILEWYCIARLAVNATGWKAFFTKAASIYRSFRLFILRNNNSQLIAYNVLRWMSTIFIL